MVAAAIAAQTERIRIGTACMVRLSMTPSSWPNASRWSTISAAGASTPASGGDIRHTIQGFGIPMDEATARYHGVRRDREPLLTEKNVSYEGKYLTIDDVTVIRGRCRTRSQCGAP